VSAEFSPPTVYAAGTVSDELRGHWDLTSDRSRYIVGTSDQRQGAYI
jgi:hypothetical protein